MKASHLAEFSVGQLVEAFRDASFGLADEVDNEKAHREFDDRLQQLKEEFRRRDPDARRALLPPSALVGQVNRATAETAQDTALAEGLAPLQLWVKRLVEDRC